jgi:hypothetical protein
MKQRVYRTEIVDVFGLLSLNFFFKILLLLLLFYLSFVFSFLSDQIVGKSFIILVGKSFIIFITS